MQVLAVFHYHQAESGGLIRVVSFANIICPPAAQSDLQYKTYRAKNRPAIRPLILFINNFKCRSDLPHSANEDFLMHLDIKDAGDGGSFLSMWTECAQFIKWLKEL